MRGRVLSLIALAFASALVAGAAAPRSVAVAGGPADVLDLVRVGTGGTGGLTNASTPVSIVPLLGVGTGMGTTGTPIQLPTAASGTNAPFALSGSAGSEGALSLSSDGRY